LIRVVARLHRAAAALNNAWPALFRRPPEPSRGAFVLALCTEKKRASSVRVIDLEF